MYLREKGLTQTSLAGKFGISNKAVSKWESVNKVHDRYIVLDYGTKTMKVYHCGASSKDAGKKITTITEIKGGDVYRDIIKSLLTNPLLTLN